MSGHTVPDTEWLWAARGTGALLGSAISLAYMLPRGRREAALRFAVGVVSGIVFGSITGLKLAAELGVAESIGLVEVMLAGSALASLSAWWALGFLMRLLARNSAVPKDK